MKKAVIVIGSHGAGKSRTINEHLKPLLGLTLFQRVFNHAAVTGQAFSQSLEERNGQVLSQSLEEKGLESVKDFIRRYAHFKYLVCAARPENETPSLYRKLKLGLESTGFSVATVTVEADKPDDFYKNKAKKIYRYLFN